MGRPVINKRPLCNGRQSMKTYTRKLDRIQQILIYNLKVLNTICPGNNVSVNKAYV
jgi:hypothetical protein